METHPLLTTLTEVIQQLESLTGDEGRQGFRTHELSRENLVQAVTQVEEAGRLVDALRSEAAHEVDARTLKRAPQDPQDSLAHFYGFPSSHALLKQLTLASGATIARRIRVAQHCRNKLSLIGLELPARFPEVGDAFFSGKISIETAETITRELHRTARRAAQPHIELAERVLVSHATGAELTAGVWEDADNGGISGAEGIPVHADDIKTLTAGWVAALDQDGTLPRDEQITHRYFRIGRERNGLVPVNGALVPEVAASLGRMFDAINNPRAKDLEPGLASSANSSPSSATAYHDEPRLADDDRSAVPSQVRFVPVETDTDLTEEMRDTRTGDQKRHDALATIFNVAMKHADMPKYGGEALSLTIQVTERDLNERGGTAWLHDAHGSLSPVNSAAARHAGCVGKTLKVTQEHTGRIVELEIDDRVFNATQRKAITLRDGGCIIPGCTQPASWCEIHHVEEWADGGPTHTDNGVLLCWFHHRFLETHEWNIRMVNGVPQVKAPPWLDPYQMWREARSVHKPPKIIEPPQRVSRPDRSSTSTRIISACEVTSARGWVNAPQPRQQGRQMRAPRRKQSPPPPGDFGWATPCVTFVLDPE